MKIILTIILTLLSYNISRKTSLKSKSVLGKHIESLINKCLIVERLKDDCSAANSIYENLERIQNLLQNVKKSSKSALYLNNIVNKCYFLNTYGENCYQNIVKVYDDITSELMIIVKKSVRN